MTQKHSIDPHNVIARSEGPSYQELLDREPVAAPESLREDTVPYLGSENIPFDRYLRRAFHDREVEKLWPKSWLMVCRESQLPNPGDYLSYDITRYSILVVRSPSGVLRGYHNSCRHRGRILKRGSGNATELRCPYHSFAWDLDGAFKGAPCMWDFSHIDTDDFGLPEVKLATWGGWVFINMDLEATPLLEHMGIVPEHFARWEIDQRYVSMHIEKVIACNWKVATEAFIESYHAIQTHPQILVYSGIDNSQYDVWGDNVSRTITTMGVVNPSHTNVYTEQDCIDTILGTSALIGSSDEEQTIEQGRTARERIAEISYADFNAQWGRDIRGEATQSEVMDSILYLVFPNFMPWGGYLPTLTYRHRPNGDDHESCIMDIYILTHFPEGSARPADASTIRLGIDEPFSKAKEMGEALGRIFDQDGANLPQVQRGMKASRTGEGVLANYQEIRIRQFHQTLDKYLDA
jgi:phenylpropionate dioxygenase-like ring-hydroxylating dioxygenase large terminal subunit